MILESNILKVKTGWILLFFMLHFSGLSQFPYEMRANTDYSLIGLGALTLTTSQVISNNVNPLSPQEIASLNSNDINAFDRNAVNNYSTSFNNVSEGVLLGTGVASLSLLANKHIRKEWVTMGVMGIEVLMLNYGIAGTVKGSVLRTRPYVYNLNVDLEKKQNVDARLSMYSQTTSATAAISFFAVKVFQDTHPNSKWKPVVWTGAAVLPALTGWAKVKAGEHFASDVMVGYSVGALIGYFVPVMHLKKKSEGAQLQLYPQTNGMTVQLTF